jgi:hypothetical protein
MVKKLVCVVFMLVSVTAVAMEQPDLVPEKTDPCAELYLRGKAVYIGHSKGRTQLEKMYGKDFPLNTIFLAVGFHLPPDTRYLWQRVLRPEHGGLTEGMTVPEYVSYELVKDVQEGRVIDLSLYGKLYKVMCKQQRERNCYDKTPFHQVVSNSIQQFSSHVNYLREGESEQSLKDAEVIDAQGKHGSKCSPFLNTHSK